MFKPFSSNSRAEDVCVLLDIGNGSVGGSLVRFSKGDKPSIVYSVRYPLHIPEKPTTARLFEKMTKLLEEVADNLAKEGTKHLDFKLLPSKDLKHVFCVLSSPWYDSMSRVYRIERKNPAPVTEEFVSDLLNKEAKEIERTLEAGAKKDLKFIEQKVVRTRLNGYDTKYPYGQVARSVELGVFMSMSPDIVIERIRSVVSRRFSADHIVFHSFALMSYSVIDDLFQSLPNYMFMDVTGEVTELSVVRRNLITGSFSIPHGRNLLIRAIAKKHKVAPDIAATYVKLYNSGNADAGLRKDMEAAIASTGKEWAAALDKALREAAKDKAVPGRIFVTVDEDVAPLFLKFISSIDHERHLLHEPWNVTVLNKDILAHFCTFGRSSREDAFLAIESMYFNKVFHL